MPPSLFYFLYFLLSTITSANALKPTFPSLQSLCLQQNPDNKSDYKPHFFPQILDHFTFTPQSSKIFYQKYLLNSEYWDGPKKRAPIFVYTGNEGDIEWFAANTGFLLDIAPKFRALLVFIEHRFYGESMPFGKGAYKSATTLGYLTSQQALADYATLITSLKQNLSAQACPVVVFGGSYGGMLAAWFRLKYPHIAMGAVASSAPILQFDDIASWTSFYDGVSKDFKDASLNCFNVIRASWDKLQVISTQEKGLQKLNRVFRTCEDIKSVYSVRDWLWSAFVYTAMVNYPTPANFMRPLPAYPINEACTEMVMPMSCSQQGMFPPSTFSYKEIEDDCMKKYGVKARPHWITTEFGGHNIEEVLKRFGSNIIFSNGMVDPWSRGGVLKNISSSIVALVTEKGAHHLDFRFATRQDPRWLVEQRRQEIELIQGWIHEYNMDFMKRKAGSSGVTGGGKDFRQR
ncbi:lysosomal Pro-X carboxypeptidase isoform X2 [Amborella trichopoda]|uniref:lysosomal Pro-X carboxypeptidase isoform X2 n=1 Tax=Amborella trichopoda TaxID=13333 RepID=UPI0005D31938|nr:lysosomal Pro-X carboxypeptidase isoform X2 [Amborella trichopoda]|eukprot:XP_011622147.1 lysosomal Pro-X carboxypeptidase isoform X2 [Amborella trichopoda]